MNECPKCGVKANNMKTLDIIIPIYNQERYLARCLDSILQQKPQNTRLILVNDGSTDTSLQICMQYKKKFDNITIINKPNGGLADARNAGLAEVTGDLVAFIDPDDCVENNYFSTIRECTEEKEFFCFSYKIKHIDFGETAVLIESGVLETGAAICKLQSKGMFNCVWNKIYNRKILQANHIMFQINSEPGEDLLFNCEYFKHINRIVISEKAIYNYMRNGGESLANKFRSDLWQKSKVFMSAIENIYKYYNLNDAKSQKILALNCIKYIHANIPNMYRPKTKFKKEKRLGFYREILADAHFINYFSVLETEDKLLLALKRIYLKNSAKKMDAYYSFLMLIRNNFQSIYNVLRRKSK